ncbi:PREDICTED: jouberin-like isoform X1 [Priapulus caudatus]|uniref:Jouberin-like isoform X1 n=3 Tax=Priapulus caudatus TaxID=37621 RepID=A0ABM1FBK9_PRICU|nr:PREDICTED: jouberin-like isoform X1 [Priapulus caudatus]
MAADVMQKSSNKLHKLKTTKAHHHHDDETPLAGENVKQARQQTKSKLDELLKAAINTEEPRLKPKKKKNGNHSMIDSLKRDIEKNSEDGSLLANMYDPDGSTKDSGYTKQRHHKIIGEDNLAYEDETITTLPRKQKKKKKKNESRRQPSCHDREMSISELQRDSSAVHGGEAEEISRTPKKKKKTQRTSVADDISHQRTVTPPVPKPRSSLPSTPIKAKPVHAEPLPPSRKKKKKKPDELPEEEEIELKDLSKRKSSIRKNLEETEIVTAQGEQEEALPDEEATTAKVKKKKKKEVRLVEPGEETAAAAAASSAAAEDTSPQIADDGRVLSVTIHKTDRLQTDFLVSHPLVKVHVIDGATGQYMKKFNKERSVTSYYEMQNRTVDHILPIATQPFDFKIRKSMTPVWEEMVVFNENANYFIDKSSQALLFFEILDLNSMSTAALKFATRGQQSGWHHVAWAFLKLVGANGQPNVGRRVRLQLYLPPAKYITTPGTIDVYQWWLTQPRRKYPSTLYVTADCIRLPASVEPGTRSMVATQEEQGRLTYEELRATAQMKLKGLTAERKPSDDAPSAWSRLAGQPCRVPNKQLLVLPAGAAGCFVLTFSCDGKRLACACQDGDAYPVIVYEIPAGAVVARLRGHAGVVYDLCWSRDDARLLSASSDSTVRLWDTIEFSAKMNKVLPHPSFVYASKFHPRVASVVVTAGYDHVLRVWTALATAEGQPNLEQELEGHRTHVNALCFNRDGDKLYSADSNGVVCVWDVYVTERKSKKGVLREWTLLKEVREAELQGVSVSHLEMHPSGHRLLLHCRDNALRMLDLRIFSITQKYHGSLNFRERLRSCITPCGTFVMSGSEDGMAYVWNTDTGDHVAVYSELPYKHTVADVRYHPHDHIVAFCSFKQGHPILVYKYDHKVAQVGMMFHRVNGTPRPSTPTQDAPDAAKTMREEASPKPGSTVVRMDRVLKKLRSVSAFQHNIDLTDSFNASLSGTMLQSLLPDTTAATQRQQQSTFWGSTFDQSQYLSALSTHSPSALSPHARMTDDTAAQHQLFASQRLYARQDIGGGGSQRPQFSKVGQPGPPRISGIEMVKQSGSYPQVVALYDYKAQRSDELDLACGDIVTVLYRDTENWWMGETVDGQQGFFPANYVAEQSDADPKEERSDTPIKKTRALVEKGELKFVSASELEHEEEQTSTPVPSARKKKKGKKTTSDA